MRNIHTLKTEKMVRDFERLKQNNNLKSKIHYLQFKTSKLQY